MEKPFETIWHRFIDVTGIRDFGTMAGGDTQPDYKTRRMLEHIDAGLHSLHAKVDHINRRIETMDAHVKALSDAVNNIVATINTTSAAITDAVAKLRAGISAEDDSAIDAAVASLNAAGATLVAANIALSGANKPVAAATGGQSMPASGASDQTVAEDPAMKTDAADGTKPVGDTETTAAKDANQ